jgi:hypothetical protein
LAVWFGAGVAGQAGQQEHVDCAAEAARLAEPAVAMVASARLVAAGPEAVPVLRRLLASPDAPGASAALYVLGRLGAASRTALPEVEECLGLGSLPVRNQALWAVGQIAAATRDRELCRECRSCLDLKCTPEQDAFLYDEADERLRLALGKPLDLVAERNVWPAPSGGRVAASAQAIANGEAPATPAHWRQLGVLLARAVTRHDRPWLDERWLEPAAGELAAALVARGDPAAGDVALGLLCHWDPERRRRGLEALSAPLPPAAQRAVVDLLWDRDAGVQHAALQTIAAWGAAALPALAALRQWTEFGGDFGARCGDAAEQILTAAAGGDDRRLALLREIDEALRGRLVPQRGRPYDASMRAAIGAVLFGCRGTDLHALGDLTDLAFARAGCEPAVVQALVHLLDRTDGDVCRVALAALARYGRVVLDQVPDFAAVCAGIGGADAVEAEALIVAGADATIAELCSAIEDPDVRIAIRALAELHARSACAAPIVRRALADYLQPPPRDEYDDRFGWLRVPYAGQGWRSHDVGAEFQFARALACAAAGLPLPPVEDDAAAERERVRWLSNIYMTVPLRTDGVAFVARDLGIPEQDPAGWIASATNDQRAAAFVALEARVRQKTGLQDFAARVGGGR